MRNFKLTIEYDGTQFNGWQIQAKNTRTVQGEIEKALKKLFKKKTRLIGSGRTDSGVHALGQVANFKASTRLRPNELLKALNANLPRDIAILQVEEVPLSFHAQYSTKRKAYRYTILNRVAPCAQQNRFCFHYPYRLNVNAIRQEAKALVGNKDFRSFQSSDPAKRKMNTVRRIYRFDIKKKGDSLVMEVEANGFLYKMVRNMVGTLLGVGKGQLPKGSIKRIVAQKNRQKAGDTAKAKGLCLVEVVY